jgi:hypothetical protein
MNTADQYQQYAEECIRWAAQTKNEVERKAFLAMARAWTEAAWRIEEMLEPIGADPPSNPTCH